MSLYQEIRTESAETTYGGSQAERERDDKRGTRHRGCLLGLIVREVRGPKTELGHPSRRRMGLVGIAIRPRAQSNKPK